ncbi:MAG: MFS transporter [Steroidobacteraceae bacterium]
MTISADVPQVAVAPKAGSEGDYPPAAYSWYVVAVLTLTYTVSFIDRQIMALMIDPIRKDLQISDTQVSLLIGLAFAVFYTLLGIPIARLADRYSRRKIIAIGITVWCFMTASCGLARSYGQLFLTRVGVGVGEAALSPSALSMMSDYFPKRTRGRAIAVYNTGISLGTGLAMIVGGSLVAHVIAAPPVVLPVVGELFAWQTVFMIVGLPGLVMAMLMLTVREPRRREQLTGADGATNLSFGTVARYLQARIRMYGTHFLGMSTVAILAYGLSAWVPTMFVRTWNWSIRDIGIAYGVVTLAAGPLAVLLASWLSERLQARGYQDAQMRSAVFCIGVAVIGALGTALASGPWVAVAFLVPASVGTTAATANGLSALMTVTPNQMRAQGAAMYYLVVNVFGLTLGPTGIALFTDYVFHNDGALRYSIACIAALAGVLSACFLFYNLGQYRKAFAESEVWSKG